MPERLSAGRSATNLAPGPSGLSTARALSCDLTFRHRRCGRPEHLPPLLRRVHRASSVAGWVRAVGGAGVIRGPLALRRRRALEWRLACSTFAVISANKVFRYATKHRLVVNNPVSGVDLPKVQHAQTLEALFLSPPEVTALGAALDQHAPDGLFVRLAAYAGLRSGEARRCRFETST